MTAQEYHQIEAEKAFLSQQLAQLPESSTLTRMSLQSRLGMLAERTKEAIVEAVAAVSKITFRGQPVVGQEGIYSDFALKAMAAFTDSIAVLAASFTNPLAPVGPVPDRDQNQFLITGVAKGSFGFVLEEKPQGQLALDPVTPVSQAVEKFQEVVESTKHADDEQLTESIAGLDRRALDKIRTFLETLNDNGALCALEHGERVLRLDSLAQVRTGIQKLACENIREERQEISGWFIGVLPRSRTFEFLRSDNNQVIKGKILPNLAGADLLNQHLTEATQAQFIVMTAGNGRPRYTLAVSPWQPLRRTPP